MSPPLQASRTHPRPETGTGEANGKGKCVNETSDRGPPQSQGHENVGGISIMIFIIIVNVIIVIIVVITLA